MQNYLGFKKIELKNFFEEITEDDYGLHNLTNEQGGDLKYKKVETFLMYKKGFDSTEERNVFVLSLETKYNATKIDASPENQKTFPREFHYITDDNNTLYISPALYQKISFEQSDVKKASNGEKLEL
ncbi:MAG: hypothetical protein SFT90_08340 [Rickettsiales bacterium]|nr:hypothetical protein [Rickettsiales bacterium]